MFETTAAILLASGLASRFEGGDKLLASLRGDSVLAHAARPLRGLSFGARLGVVGTSQTARQAALRDLGFSLVLNPAPAAGQGHSLACGIRAATALTGIDRALILLGDMPGVDAALLTRLGKAMAPGVPAVMARYGETCAPPALFHRSSFAALAALDGDRGARAVFARLSGTCLVDSDARGLIDIDTTEDLHRAEEIAHG